MFVRTLPTVHRSSNVRMDSVTYHRKHVQIIVIIMVIARIYPVIHGTQYVRVN